MLNYPATAVAMLANHLGARGESLQLALILSGITEAVAVSPGDHVSLRIQGLGGVSIRCLNREIFSLNIRIAPCPLPYCTSSKAARLNKKVG